VKVCGRKSYGARQQFKVHPEDVKAATTTMLNSDAFHHFVVINPFARNKGLHTLDDERNYEEP
jgi:hypothetical protein